MSTPVWIDYDGEAVLVNSAYGRTKVTNIAARPARDGHRPAGGEPAERLRHGERTAELVDEGAREHIDKMAKKYLGEDKYPYLGPGEQRVIIKIHPESRRRLRRRRLMRVTALRRRPAGRAAERARCSRTATCVPISSIGSRRRGCRGSRPRRSSATTAYRRWPAPRTSPPGSRTRGNGVRGSRPEPKGYERLRETTLGRVNCTLAATESFNQRNGNMSLEQALTQTDGDSRRVRAADDRNGQRRVRLPLRGTRRSGTRRRALRAARGGRARPCGHDRRRHAHAGQAPGRACPKRAA